MKWSTFPSTTLGALFVLPAFLSLGLLWQPAWMPLVLALDGLLALTALFDFLASRRVRFEVTRSSRDVFSVGEPNAVDVSITLRGPRALSIELRGDLPEYAQSPEFPLRARLRPGRTEVLRHHVIPEERGASVLGDHFVRTTSPLGLWVRQCRISARDPVRIYPDLATIRSYELLARKHRQYALVRASALRGGESEFARLRDYTTDDDPRFVDWKATARRGVLTSREFQLESDQNIVLCLDAGRLMTAVVDGLSQFDHALNAGLLMAHVACRGGDRVGLLCFDREVRAFVPPEGGPRATHKLVRACYALQPELTDSAFSVGLSFLHQRLKQRSLIVLFTQLLDDAAAEELVEHIRLLSRKHLPLVVLLEDTDLIRELEAAPAPSDARALYRKGAAAEILLWKNQAIATLKRNGAFVIETSIDKLTPELVNRYLELKARRAL